MNPPRKDKKKRRPSRNVRRLKDVRGRVCRGFGEFANMAEIKGATLIAQCLKHHGIRELFGVIGYPVTEIAFRAQEQGLRYIGTRHEQTAGFAAQAIGYLRR